MKIWRSVWITVVFLSIAFLLYAILDTIRLFLNLTKYEYNFYNIIENIVSQIFSFLIIKRLFFQNDEVKINAVRIPWRLVMIFLIFVIGSIIFLLGYNNILDSLLNTNKMGNVNGDAPFEYLLIRLVKGCIVAPIIEELFFRNFVQKKLEQNYSSATAILSASAFFAAYHAELESFFYLIMMGFIYGFIFYKTKRIEYSIICHSLMNLITYSLNFYFQNSDLSNKSFNFIYVILGIIISFGGILLLNKLYESKEKPRENL